MAPIDDARDRSLEMTTLGQKGHFERVPGTSAITPFATGLLHYGTRCRM
jgi:hypothetical protein